MGKCEFCDGGYIDGTLCGQCFTDVFRMNTVGDGEWVQDDNGPFVGYWDYRSLEKKLAEVQAENEFLRFERDRLQNKAMAAVDAAQKAEKAVATEMVLSNRLNTYLKDIREMYNPVDMRLHANEAIAHHIKARKL